MLVACRAVPLAVNVTSGLLIPEGADRYEVRENEIFIVADTFGEQPLPDYPESVLPMNLPLQTVCVDVIISTEGTVSDVRPNYDKAGCQASENAPVQAFIDSTRDAVLKWQFFAAAICRFPPGIEPNDRCEGDDVQIVPVPLKLTYYFDFEQTGGKPRVRRGRR